MSAGEFLQLLEKEILFMMAQYVMIADIQRAAQATKLLIMPRLSCSSSHMSRRGTKDLYITC